MKFTNKIAKETAAISTHHSITIEEVHWSWPC